MTEEESRVIMEDHCRLLLNAMDDTENMNDSQKKAFEGWTDRLKAKARSLRTKNRKSTKAVELKWHLKLIEGERAKEVPLIDCTKKELAFHFDFLQTVWAALQDPYCKLIPKL